MRKYKDSIVFQGFVSFFLGSWRNRCTETLINLQKRLKTLQFVNKFCHSQNFKLSFLEQQIYYSMKDLKDNHCFLFAGFAWSSNTYKARVVSTMEKILFLREQFFYAKKYCIVFLSQVIYFHVLIERLNW